MARKPNLPRRAIVKGKPGFTIEEAYEEWRKTGQRAQKSKLGRLPVEAVISEGSRMVKLIAELKIEELS